MPDRDMLARVLIARSAELTLGPGATRESLEVARFALAHSLARETDLEDAPDPGEQQLATARAYFEPGSAEAALSVLGVGDRFTLERADQFQFLTGQQQPTVFGIKLANRVGPFIDVGGRQIYFNLYGSAHGRTVHVPGLGRPALVMTSGRLPDVAHSVFRLSLDPGTIWVLASLLDPAAPEDGYVGFNVVSGSAILPAIPTVAGDRLTLAAPGPIHLSLMLTAPSPPSANPACSFGAIVAPQAITITLFGAPAFSGVQGSLSLGDSITEMEAGSGIEFDSTWNMVAFGCSPQLERLDLAHIVHAIAQFSGELPIDHAGWAVPVTRPSDPNTLGEADAGAAGWLLHLGEGGGRAVAGQW